jgi:hypothetical protein
VGILTKQVAILQDFLRVFQVFHVSYNSTCAFHSSTLQLRWYSRPISGHSISVQKEDDGILMYTLWNLIMDPLRHKIGNFFSLLVDCLVQVLCIRY